MESLFLPLLLIAALALLMNLNWRRQKRAIAEAQRLQDSLTVGDRVITTSGLQATVVSIADERTIDLEIAPGVCTTWLRAVIREKVTDEVPADDTTDDSAPGDAAARLAPQLEDNARTDRP